MTREEFVTFLQNYEFQLPLQHQGGCAGLPVELGDALDVADAAREMGMAAPASDAIRRWYAPSSGTRHPRNPALHAIESLNQLYSDDFAALDLGELLLFATKCATVAHVARRIFHNRRASLNMRDVESCETARGMVR